MCVLCIHILVVYMQDKAPTLQDKAASAEAGTPPVAKSHQERACGTSAVDGATDTVCSVDAATDAVPSSPRAPDDSSDGETSARGMLWLIVLVYEACSSEGLDFFSSRGMVQHLMFAIT